MDENKNYQPDPWESGIYETGRTRPPKSHTGLIALLLVVVIFLSGLVSFMGLLNVRLFAQLNAQPEEKESSVSFVSETEEAPDILEIQDPSAAALEPTAAPSADPGAFQLNPSPESVPNVPQNVGLSLQDIYDKTIGSVVSISCTGSYGASTGTGVVLTSGGYVVTNAHVVQGAGSISVLLSDERSFPATLVGADTISDLAVLHIEAEDLIPAEFGDSSVLRVGDSVVAIGDPLGMELRGTMTNGIVSAINRDVTTGGRTLTLIQTNAALNSGNSGGPLINCFGQVIGINTMKMGDFASSSGVEGLGFAIPSTTVKEIADQLIEQGYVSGRPTLGLTGETVSAFYQFYYHLPNGMYISEIDPQSDAARKGLEAGDILISVDDTRISNMDELEALLSNYDVGDTVRIVIYRAGRQYSAQLTLHESKG
ncbi:MAG: PDZ domain-containing protein [Ruminococcaceae bacterium]|nr:PDZ domain-containing protein [Oscillospiraceae bacterium]